MKEKIVRTCGAPGCDSTDLIARYLCWRHYQQLRRTGKFRNDNWHPPGCQAPDCRRPGYGHTGHCVRHYNQIRIHGRLTPELEHTSPPDTRPCTEPGCRRRTQGGPWCREHRSQILRQGSTVSTRGRTWVRHTVTPAQELEMIRLRRQGMTLADIADQLRFSAVTVQKRIKKHLSVRPEGVEPSTDGL